MTISVMKSVGNTGNSQGIRSPNSIGANTKSATLGVTAFTQLIASTPTYGNVVELYVYDDSGDTRHAFDLAFGAALSEVIKVPDLFRPVSDRMTRYTIPLEVPAGTRLSFRSQSHQGSRPIIVEAHVIYDDRFTKGSSPTSYVTYNVNTSGATALTAGTLTASATANTKGTPVSYVSSIPAGTTHMIIGGSPPSVFAAHYLMDVLTSADNFATAGTVLHSNLSAWSNNPVMPITLPLQGLDGLALGFVMQSSSNVGPPTRAFSLHLGIGGVAGADGAIVHEEISMQTVIKGAASPVFFKIYAEDGKTPWSGSVTGKKILYRINGAGADVPSVADIVRVRTAWPWFYVILGTGETSPLAIGDILSFGIDAIAGQHMVVDTLATVFEAAITAAPPAVYPSDVWKVNGTTITGDGSSGNKWRKA